VVCEHLRELYQLCEKNKIKLSSSDLIHILCTECNNQETLSFEHGQHGGGRIPRQPENQQAASE